MGIARIGWIAAAAVLGLALMDAGRVGAADGTHARASEFSAQARRVRERIEIYPRPGIHRECVDGYRVVPRPYWGTSVVMPYMRCWWVRG